MKNQKLVMLAPSKKQLIATHVENKIDKKNPVNHYFVGLKIHFSHGFKPT